MLKAESVQDKVCKSFSAIWIRYILQYVSGSNMNGSGLNNMKIMMMHQKCKIIIGAIKLLLLDL